MHPADYQYNTRPDSNYGPGHFHEGFLSVANQLWDNGMRDALDAAVAAGDVKHIIITGHSLGGASTQLLSARAQVGVLVIFNLLAQHALCRHAWQSMCFIIDTFQASACRTHR